MQPHPFVFATYQRTIFFVRASDFVICQYSSSIHHQNICFTAGKRKGLMSEKGVIYPYHSEGEPCSQIVQKFGKDILHIPHCRNFGGRRGLGHLDCAFGSSLPHMYQNRRTTEDFCGGEMKKVQDREDGRIGGCQSFGRVRINGSGDRVRFTSYKELSCHILQNFNIRLSIHVPCLFQDVVPEFEFRSLVSPGCDTCRTRGHRLMVSKHVPSS